MRTRRCKCAIFLSLFFHFVRLLLSNQSSSTHSHWIYCQRPTEWKKIAHTRRNSMHTLSPTQQNETWKVNKEGKAVAWRYSVQKYCSTKYKKGEQNLHTHTSEAVRTHIRIEASSALTRPSQVFFRYWYWCRRCRRSMCTLCVIAKTFMMGRRSVIIFYIFNRIWNIEAEHIFGYVMFYSIFFIHFHFIDVEIWIGLFCICTK